MKTKCAIILFLFFAMLIPAETGAQDYRDTINYITDFESANDPKCFATAKRFKDFAFGLPLSNEANGTLFQHQKDLAGYIFKRVSSVDDQDVTTQLKNLRGKLPEYHFDDYGNLSIEPREGNAIAFSSERLRQFATIAYSLRAILAFQHENLIFENDDLPPLDEEGLEYFKEMLDVYTIAALYIAVDLAIDSENSQVQPGHIKEAWNRVAAIDLTKMSKPERINEKIKKTRYLNELIKGKINAYDKYNQLANRKLDELYIQYIEQEFAKAQLTDNKQKRYMVMKTFHNNLRKFAESVIRASNEKAELENNPLIRYQEVFWAVQKLLPHEIDDQETAVYFPNNAHEHQIRIEAYRLDAFRDFGMHWKILDEAYQNIDEDMRDVDPFAAEYMAEAIAQLALLILDLSGKQREDDKMLPIDIFRAYLDYQERLGSYDYNLKQEPDIKLIYSSDYIYPEEVKGPFFIDRTKDVGLEFIHEYSNWYAKAIESIKNIVAIVNPGAGIAAEDINNDGFIDLLLASGGGNKLLINDGQGRFEDRSDALNIRAQRSNIRTNEPKQPAIVDLDNDGLQDIIVTNIDNTHTVLRNMGNLKFEDVTRTASLGGINKPPGFVTVFDINNDGLLDIYIGYFGDFLPFDDMKKGVRQHPKLRLDNKNAVANELFLNKGNFQFENISRSSGTNHTGWTNAVSHTDINFDGWQDIIVANDFGQNAVYINLGNNTFEDKASELGINKFYHSMNASVVDLNQDLFPDIYFANINTYQRDASYKFPQANVAIDRSEHSVSSMLAVEQSILYLSHLKDEKLHQYSIGDVFQVKKGGKGWAWDSNFFDFDNDSDDDLFVLNGYEFAFRYTQQPKFPHKDMAPKINPLKFKDANMLFVNQENQLLDKSQSSGLDRRSYSIAAAFLDYDHDGDLDIVTTDDRGPAFFYQNNAQANGFNWIQIKLVGDYANGSNRDAIGARLILETTAGVKLWREIHGTSGFLSQDPKVQHFGLGNEDIKKLTIYWPNKEKQIVSSLKKNQLNIIKQVKADEARL